jgi:hypothetical protein
MYFGANMCKVVQICAKYRVLFADLTQKKEALTIVICFDYQCFIGCGR